MIKNELDALLQRKMSRRMFLGTVGVTALSLFGVFRIISELKSHADGDANAFEPETVTPGNGTTVINDGTASGGQAIKFGSGIFDGRTYDYPGNTGPRYSFTTTMNAPAFSYPSSSNVTTTGIIKGNIDRYRINSVATFDPTHKSRSQDYATSVNVENLPVQITDTAIYTSLASTALSTGTQAQSMSYCLVDPTATLSPLQGAVYRWWGTIDHTEIIGYYDGLWIGEYTRPILLNRFAAGDFSSPYISTFHYSWSHFGYEGYGTSTYIAVNYNISASPLDYPMYETGNTLGLPISPAQIAASIAASVTTPVNVHVGDFIAPDPSNPNGSAGINGGRWQVIGTTGSDRSKTAACTLGTDYASWPHASTLWTAYSKGEGGQPFVSGTAILVYLGSANHSDNSQMGHSNGHVWYYRSRMQDFSNAATIICQPTNPPLSTDTVFDPVPWPTAYLRVEECDIIVNAKNARLGYIQGQAVTDPVTGTTDRYPAYGFQSPPRWVTYINNYMGKSDGTALNGYKELYYDSKGHYPVYVASEAHRYDAVMLQLTTAGKDMLKAAHGGTMPMGAQIVADATQALRQVFYRMEYEDYLDKAQTNIIMPTDGYNGLPDNISNFAVFQNRLKANLPKSYLDARSWIVWENNKDRASGNPLYVEPAPIYLAKNPWLASDGSDNGFYTAL